MDNLDQEYNELKAKGVAFVTPPTECEEEKIKSGSLHGS